MQGSEHYVQKKNVEGMIVDLVFGRGGGKKRP